MYEDLLDNIVRDLKIKTNDDAAIIVATLFNKTTRCFETAVLVTDTNLIEHVPGMLRDVSNNIPNYNNLTINIDGIISLCRTGK